jgi:hypothetical protein
MAAMTFMISMTGYRGHPGVTYVSRSWVMVVTGVVVTTTVRRVKLWILGILRFHWNGSSMPFVVLMISHIWVLSCPYKC